MCSEYSCIPLLEYLAAIFGSLAIVVTVALIIVWLARWL